MKWNNLTDEQQARLREIVEYKRGHVEDIHFDAIDMTFPGHLVFFYNDRTAITDAGRAVYEAGQPSTLTPAPSRPAMERDSRIGFSKEAPDVNETNFKNGDRVTLLTGDEGKVIGVAQTGNNAGRVWVLFDGASQPTLVYPSSLTRLEAPAPDALTEAKARIAALEGALESMLKIARAARFHAPDELRDAVDTDIERAADVLKAK